MDCPECGALLVEEARFCTVCGGSVTDRDTVPVHEPRPELAPHETQPMISPPQPPLVEPAFVPEPRPVNEPLPAYPEIPHDIPVPPPVGEAEADFVRSIPQGCIYDPESQLYYKSEQVTDEEGRPVQRVTCYDMLTRTVTRNDYPAYTYDEVRGVAFVPERPDLNTRTDTLELVGEIHIPRRRGGGGKFLLALCVLLLALTAMWLTNRAHSPQPPQPGQEASPAPSAPNPPTSSAAPSASVPVQSGGEVAPSAPKAAPAYAPWPDFGHISSAYSDAKEDERYIYYRPEGSPRLLRIDKGEFTVETMLDVSAFGFRTVESFALYGDYLYFTVPMGSPRLGYFRVYRGGGEAQFLFTDSGGPMIASDDGIYFWDSHRGAAARYNPEEDIYPQTLPELVAPSSPERKITALGCVTDLYAYYSETDGKSVYFCRQNRWEDLREELLSGPEGEIFNPVVIEDMVYYLSHRGEYELRCREIGISWSSTLHNLGGTGAPPFFAATAADLFCQKGESCFLAPITAPDLAQPALTKQEPPSAALRDWVVWPDMAYQVKEGRMLNLLRPGETDAFSAASAFAQSEAITDNQELRNTILTAPAAENDDN